MHEAIQDACSWKNYHLYCFLYALGTPEIATSPNALEDGGEAWDDVPPPPDASSVKVADYFMEGKRATRCLYLYDFGDSWHVNVKLSRIVEQPERFLRKLIGGRRAFPPEDCGGINGYKTCVDAKYDKPVEDRDNLLEWLGEWHPDFFDRERTAELFNRGKMTWHVPFRLSDKEARAR